MSVVSTQIVQHRRNKMGQAWHEKWFEDILLPRIRPFSSSDGTAGKTGFNRFGKGLIA